MFQRFRAKLAQNLRDTPLSIQGLVPAMLILAGAHMAESLLRQFAEEADEAASELDRIAEERKRYGDTEGPEVVDGNVNKSIRVGAHDAAVKARAVALGWRIPVPVDVDELVDELRNAVRRTTANLSAGDVLHAESEVAGAARQYLAKCGLGLQDRAASVNEHA